MKTIQKIEHNFFQNQSMVTQLTYIFNPEPKYQIDQSNKMNSTQTQYRKTWAQIASATPVEVIQETVMNQGQRQDQGQILIQNAIQKRTQREQKRQKKEQKCVAKIETPIQQQSMQPPIQQQSMQPPTQQQSIQKEQDTTQIQQAIPKKEPAAKKMTPTQMRKWAQEQVKKHMAEEEARCFEEITRIAQLDDEEKESRIQRMVAQR